MEQIKFLQECVGLGNEIIFLAINLTSLFVFRKRLLSKKGEDPEDHRLN